MKLLCYCTLNVGLLLDIADTSVAIEHTGCCSLKKLYSIVMNTHSYQTFFNKTPIIKSNIL
jgi:hypothetical protein